MHEIHTRINFKISISRAIILILIIGYGPLVQAQLFPGLEGDALADAIRAEYTPTQLLTFTQAKDTLYAKVFFDNDSVHCIYSDIGHYLPSGVDPSQWVFGSGNEIESINLEHGWPQAKGAGDGTNGQRNMYNLFPSRVAINSDRGDFPYQDINDDLTTKWYYKAEEIASRPLVNINAYSEFRSGSFEPREAVKGDIARAMFYFWTIYRDDALAADPVYFDMQRDYLCHWQQDDPVDETETIRNNRISTYQGGKMNPFVLDCSLAQRAYCPLQNECESVGVESILTITYEIHFDASQSTFEIDSDIYRTWRINIFNLTGQLLYMQDLETYQRSVPLILPSGMYIASCNEGNKKAILRFFVY